MQLGDLKGYTGKVMESQPDNGADSADGYDSYCPDGSEDEYKANVVILSIKSCDNVCTAGHNLKWKHHFISCSVYPCIGQFKSDPTRSIFFLTCTKPSKCSAEIISSSLKI